MQEYVLGEIQGVWMVCFAGQLEVVGVGDPHDGHIDIV